MLKKLFVLFFSVLVILEPCPLKAKEVIDFCDPIDIVYLWVDGSDPQWQDIRNAYQASEAGTRPDAAAKNRFCDNQELKYSLRSVWKYAPFFHHIYIVTMDQKPSWLQPHPMITIVDHRDIFDDASVLPTFNSMAIECHLHRIPGLTEHFIYFNDDMFLGRPVSPLDFFTHDGKIKVLLQSKATMPTDRPKQSDNSFLLASRNANALLDQHFRRERRPFVSHAPYALMKSHMQQAEMVFFDAFRTTSSHRFRSPNDYTITNGLVQYYCRYNNKAVVGKLKNTAVILEDDLDLRGNRGSLDSIRKSKPHTFCIQDKILESNSRIPFILHQFFEKYFPEAAPWEE